MGPNVLRKYPERVGQPPTWAGGNRTFRPHRKNCPKWNSSTSNCASCSEPQPEQKAALRRETVSFRSSISQPAGALSQHGHGEYGFQLRKTGIPFSHFLLSLFNPVRFKKHRSDGFPLSGSEETPNIAPCPRSVHPSFLRVAPARHCRRSDCLPGRLRCCSNQS